jgi:hypothetical protein
MLQLATYLIWHGGTPAKFSAHVNSRLKVQSIMQCDHTPIIPRTRYEATRAGFIKAANRDYYVTSDVQGVIVCKGTVFRPETLRITNRFLEPFFTSYKQGIVMSADGKLSILGTVTGEQLYRALEPKLDKYPSLLTETVFQSNIRGLPREKAIAVFAAATDYKLISNEDIPKLKPDVNSLRERILRTLDEYIDTSDDDHWVSHLNQFDAWLIRRLSTSQWSQLLDPSQESLVLTDTDSVISKRFAICMQNCARHPDFAVSKDYFSPKRDSGVKFVISSSGAVLHTFTHDNGKAGFEF